MMYKLIHDSYLTHLDDLLRPNVHVWEHSTYQTHDTLFFQSFDLFDHI